MAWDHARKGLREEGRRATENEIAEAAATLLDTASRGPASTGSPPPQRTSKKSRRVAARTKAAGSLRPRPEPAAQPEGGTTGQGPGDPEAASGEALADVVPLGIFDAREEARRWW